MTLFFSIPTLFLGTAVAVIAWQQRQVASNKLRLDLFERRYKVYDAARQFLIQIAHYNDFDESELVNFAAGISDAEFLFGDDVVGYLKRIRERASQMQDDQAILQEGKLQQDELSRRGHAESDHRSWLKQQITDMTSVFAPYLGFVNIKYGGEIRERNKGVKRLAVFLGALGALWGSAEFLSGFARGAGPFITDAVAEGAWWVWLLVSLIPVVFFFIPFGLVHAIAWVVRGFREP